MEHSKWHHYVPQHIIRQFCFSENQVFVFDKLRSKSFTQSPKKVFAQKRFNEFEIRDSFVSFENVVTEIEKGYLPSLRRVWSGDGLNKLDDDNIGQLIVLIAFQYLRTNDFRLRFLEMQKTIHDRVIRIANGRQVSPDITPMDDNELKRFSLRLLRNSLEDFSQTLTDRHIFLIKPPEGHEFLLGENPVVLHNDCDYKLQSNLSWESPGLQIYFPINPKLCLGVWCNAVFGETFRQFKNNEDRLKTLKIMTGHNSQANYFLKEIGYKAKLDKNNFSDLYKEILVNREITATPENMKFYNSLQFSWARRFIVSKTGDFSLLEK